MSPSEEYTQRLKLREGRFAEHERVHIHLGNLRLVLALVTVLMVWLSFRHMFSAWWLTAPVLSFLAIAVYHSRVLEAKSQAERAAAFYRAGLARIQDRWQGTGQTGDRFTDLHHVYAADLDLFGKGSLFELLSTARTRMGEDTLAAWLLSPASVPEICNRQQAVAELRDKLDLREDLSVLGEDARVGVHPEALIKWTEWPIQLRHTWIRLLAPVLAVCAVAAAVVWGVWDFMAPFIAVFLIEVTIAFLLRHRVDAVLHGTEHAFDNLKLLSSVLSRIERESLHSPKLRQLADSLTSHHIPGSQAIARLTTIAQLIESRENLILRVLDLPLLYSVQVAYLAESWRRAHGSDVRQWLSALGEIEALISFSAHSYEHPEDPFPELVEGKACFDTQQLGHPLIPAAACVRNDVKVCDTSRVLLVSGSNMSGKSTLLRAIGLNTVMAMAGAPVRARKLRLTALQVGASIRINDSLQEGSSRFYAEIKRLRKIFDLAGKDPQVLFLLDELLQGTNSKDRRIGAEGLVKALLERGAVGLVTTHDLALTDIGGPFDGHLRNVHFQDEFTDGKIYFDYKLREGVVTKSNGLELMRSIGLNV